MDPTIVAIIVLILLVAAIPEEEHASHDCKTIPISYHILRCLGFRFHGLCFSSIAIKRKRAVKVII